MMPLMKIMDSDSRVRVVHLGRKPSLVATFHKAVQSVLWRIPLTDRDRLTLKVVDVGPEFVLLLIDERDNEVAKARFAQRAEAEEAHTAVSACLLHAGVFGEQHNKVMRWVLLGVVMILVFMLVSSHTDKKDGEALQASSTKTQDVAPINVAPVAPLAPRGDSAALPPQASSGPAAAPPPAAPVKVEAGEPLPADQVLKAPAE